MALGICKAIIDRGLKIPKNVGLVGYDDIESSKYYFQPLTTIKNPSYDIGIIATEMLIEKIKSKDSLKVDKVILKPELVIRETT